MDMLRALKRRRDEPATAPDGGARLAAAVRAQQELRGVIDDVTTNISIEDVQMHDVPADAQAGLRVVARALCLLLRGPTDQPVAGARATARPGDAAGRYVVAAAATVYSASVDVSGMGLAALVADPGWDVRHPAVRAAREPATGATTITITVDVARAQ
jgi:hypothetical protein